jgi:hypothetical protein
LSETFLNNLADEIFEKMEELKEVMAKKTLTYNDVSKFDDLTRTLTKKYDDEIIKNGHMVLRPTKDHPHSGKTMRIQRS